MRIKSVEEFSDKIAMAKDIQKLILNDNATKNDVTILNPLHASATAIVTPFKFITFPCCIAAYPVV